MRSTRGRVDAAFFMRAHARRAGAGGRGRRRVDAAEVDLLLPEDPDRAAFQRPGIATHEDLHTQGRRRHHRPLVRRPRVEVRTRVPTHTASLDEAASALGLARAAATRRGSPPTSSASRTSCSSPAPSWRPRPRPPAGSSPASPRSRRRWSTGSSRLIDHYMDRVTLPPKFVIPGGTRAVRAAGRGAHDRSPCGATRRRVERRGELPDVTILHLPESGIRRRVRDGPLRGRTGPEVVRGTQLT